MLRIDSCARRVNLFPGLLAGLWLLVGLGGADARDANTIYLNPDWSPDGSKIAFESGPDGQLSIYSVDVDGSNLTQLTDDRYNDEGPVWSPDGSKIAFFSNRSKRRHQQPVSLQVYVMNADGSGQVRLTDEASALDYNISWSPDGSMLVFQSRPEINPGVHSLYRVNVDGSGRTRITDGLFNDTAPQWSPDGRWILYVRSPALYRFFQDLTPEETMRAREAAEIALLNVQDGTTAQVTRNRVRDFDPSWVPGKAVFYYFQDDGDSRALIRQSPGGDPHVVVAAGHAVSNPGRVTRTRVSPDERFLVFAREVDGVHGIYIHDLERGAERLLVGNPVAPLPENRGDAESR